MNLFLKIFLASVLWAGAFSLSDAEAKKAADGDITGLLSPEGAKIGRPDAVAIGDRLYLAFNDAKKRNSNWPSSKPGTA